MMDMVWSICSNPSEGTGKCLPVCPLAVWWGERIRLGESKLPSLWVRFPKALVPFLSYKVQEAGAGSHFPSLIIGAGLRRECVCFSKPALGNTAEIFIVLQALAQ